MRGSSYPQIASILNNEARILIDRGDFDDARSRLQRAIEIREKANGPTDTKLAYPLTSLANLHAKQGDSALAVPLLERALKLRLDAQVGGSDLATTRLALAQAVAGTDPARAETLARQARTGFVEADDAEGLAEADRWMGEQGIAPAAE
jgi:tetratricopeptide (TPR) repeat protein